MKCFLGLGSLENTYHVVRFCEHAKNVWSHLFPLGVNWNALNLDFRSWLLRNLISIASVERYQCPLIFGVIWIINGDI